MDRYLERYPLTVIDPNGDELTYTKDVSVVHAQCYINMLPLHFDVICVIKEFLYYGGMEIKINMCRDMITQQIYNMNIYREINCDINWRYISRFQSRIIENMQMNSTICVKCGNYQHLDRADFASFSNKTTCNCLIPFTDNYIIEDDDRVQLLHGDDIMVLGQSYLLDLSTII